MQYELSLICALCGYHKSIGGFGEPQTLTNEQVLAQMEHNPGCALLHATPEAVNIESADVVRRYVVSSQSQGHMPDVHNHIYLDGHEMTDEHSRS
jgi:hypothetical protein